MQRLHATALTAQEAKLLDLPDGSPALFIERISYLPDGRIIEFTRSHYRGDSYDFVAELTIAPGSKIMSHMAREAAEAPEAVARFLERNGSGT